MPGTTWWDSIPGPPSTWPSKRKINVRLMKSAIVWSLFKQPSQYSKSLSYQARPPLFSPIPLPLGPPQLLTLLQTYFCRNLGFNTICSSCLECPSLLCTLPLQNITQMSLCISSFPCPLTSGYGFSTWLISLQCPKCSLPALLH